MTAPLRVGVIGAGHMGRLHLRVLGELEGVEPVLAVDPFCTNLPVPVVATLDEAAGRIDAAVLAAPTELHEALGLRLAELRVPTLVEKPIASTRAAARRLMDAFGVAGVPAAAGHVERCNPVTAPLREAVAAGAIGAVTHASTVRVGPFPERAMPVGVVTDLLVHDVDLVTHVLDARYDRVSATTRHDEGRPCEDEALVRGTLVDAEGRELTVTHHASRVSPTRERRIELVGERGRLVADLVSQTVTRIDADGTATPLTVGRGQPLARELEAWRDLVRGGTASTGTVLATLADGMRAVAVCDAILTSAAAGHPVRLAAA